MRTPDTVRAVADKFSKGAEAARRAYSTMRTQGVINDPEALKSAMADLREAAEGIDAVLEAHAAEAPKADG